MGKPNKNESGFSVVETILALVIIALVGVVGYMVYTNHHKTTSTTKPIATSSKTVSSTRYLKVTQFSIELPLSNTISDLNYTWENDNAGFGSAALIKYAKTQDPSECSFTNPDGGVAATTYELGYINSGSAPSDFTGDYKLYTIGGKTYTLYLPGNGCATSGSSSANNVVNEVELYENALENALQNAKTY